MPDNIELGDWVEIIIDLEELEREFDILFKKPHQYFSQVTDIHNNVGNGNVYQLKSISEFFYLLEKEIKKVEL